MHHSTSHRKHRKFIAVATSVLIVSACGSDGSPASVDSSEAASSAAPVETFVVDVYNHVEGPVDYDQTPPIGGQHHPVWQNCGVYDESVPNETGVHSLEHGAVWIAYTTDLDAAAVDVLAGLARNQSHVLVSPFDDLDAPIVASAWGAQQQFSDANDPAIVDFIETFQLGAGSPEPGAPCAGGVGEPS